MDSLNKLKSEIIFCSSINSNTKKSFLDSIKNIEEELEISKRRSISWSVEDLKYQATLLQEYNPNLEFDETKFEDILELIIKQHDATIGINWDVIQIYLMEHCKK